MTADTSITTAAATNSIEGPWSVTVISLDLEATGRLAHQDRIIQIGARNMATGAWFNERVRPAVRMTAGASRVTGVHDADLVDCPPLAGVAARFLAWLKEQGSWWSRLCLVAHSGAYFDFPLLDAELARCSLSLPQRVHRLDTHPVFMSLRENFGVRGASLAEWHQELCRAPIRHQHDALADADALAAVLRKILNTSDVGGRAPFLYMCALSLGDHAGPSNHAYAALGAWSCTKHLLNKVF